MSRRPQRLGESRRRVQRKLASPAPRTVSANAFRAMPIFSSLLR